MSKICENCGATNQQKAKFCGKCGEELEKKRDFKFEQNTTDSQKATEKFEDDISFTWWKVWGWLGITLGNISLLGTFLETNETGIGFLLILINTILMIFVLNFNKYAFLIATILSLNPLLWIINGIYLKNRWQHPKINKKEE